jgi:hypothetical protein
VAYTLMEDSLPTLIRGESLEPCLWSLPMIYWDVGDCKTGADSEVGIAGPWFPGIGQSYHAWPCAPCMPLFLLPPCRPPQQTPSCAKDVSNPEVGATYILKKVPLEGLQTRPIHRGISSVVVGTHGARHGPTESGIGLRGGDVASTDGWDGLILCLDGIAWLLCDAVASAHTRRTGFEQATCTARPPVSPRTPPNAKWKGKIRADCTSHRGATATAAHPSALRKQASSIPPLQPADM